jgi:ABC-type arginine transport system permease subunit
MRKFREKMMTVLLAVFTWGVAAVPAFAQAIAPVGADEVATKLVNTLNGVVRPIGMVVIFGVVAWAAFKLITTANNPTGRAETMESLPYIVIGGIALGAVMLFSGFIVSLMIQVGG